MNIPLHPKHPERVCWGCDKYCPANDLRCGKERAAHPIEDYGDAWAGASEPACDRERDRPELVP